MADATMTWDDNTPVVVSAFDQIRGVYSNGGMLYTDDYIDYLTCVHSGIQPAQVAGLLMQPIDPTMHYKTRKAIYNELRPTNITHSLILSSQFVSALCIMTAKLPKGKLEYMDAANAQPSNFAGAQLTGVSAIGSIAAKQLNTNVDYLGLK
jgi:hypothetical protein